MTWKNEDYIASIKKFFKKCFQMIDLGHLHDYLGIEVTQHPKYISISQKTYIEEFFTRFCMTECNTLSNPMKQKLKLTSSEGK